MTRPLLIDHRHRLVSAVEDGMSRRSAAKRFGVSPSSAIRRVDHWTREGHVTPGAQGGDNRSHRPEAFADDILGLIDRTSDITLAEIAEYLEEVHGFRSAQSAVRRLLDRHGMTFKKQRAQASSSVPTSFAAAKSGLIGNRTCHPRGWFLLMRQEPRPKWRGCGGERGEENDVAHRCHMVTGKPPRSSAPSDCRA